MTTCVWSDEPRGPQQKDDSRQPNVWLRTVIAGQSRGNSPVQLRVAAPGTLSIWFNGQRLGRQLSSKESQLVFDVTSLYRTTRNSVAIALHPGRQPVQVSAWLTLGDGGKRVPLSAWKIAPKTPPVGWQQTDFNDRDWKPLQLSPQDAAGALPERQIAWSRNGSASHVRGGRFVFRDGDHVLLIGPTFIERAQEYGHLEAALGRSGGRVTFRNLGWSADTVFAESRGIFDSPERGYERLIEQVRAEEPSVILVCYGQNEAMTDESPGRFVEGLRRMVDDLATTGAEVVVMSPHPFLPARAPLPNPAVMWNDRLKTFAAAAATVAEEKGLYFVDLQTDFVPSLRAAHRRVNSGTHVAADAGVATPAVSVEEAAAWTDNGMHFNNDGYAAVSSVVADRLLGADEGPLVVDVNIERRSVSSKDGTVQNIVWQQKGAVVSFDVTPAQVTARLPVVRIAGAENPLQVQLTADSAAGPGESLAVALVSDHEGRRREYRASRNPNYERLRQLIVRKNELYFHRWRPQNITYLYGFRKHEQGNNAVEIAQFDPLVAQLETEIHAARQPQTLHVTISNR